MALIQLSEMEVSINGGTPKIAAYFKEIPTKMDDSGVPAF